MCQNVPNLLIYRLRTYLINFTYDRLNAVQCRAVDTVALGGGGQLPHLKFGILIAEPNEVFS